MYRALGLILIALVSVVLYLHLSELNSPFFPQVFDSKPLVNIEDVPIRVDVADTAEERTLGLGRRDLLPATEGLLFIFPESDYHAIWMKDMRFAIDVIWIDENLRVVDILPDLKPETFPRSFEPRAPARFVLETNSHYAESFGIQIGDSVSIPEHILPEDLR